MHSTNYLTTFKDDSRKTLQKHETKRRKKKSKLVLKKDCSTAIFNIFSYELIIFRKQINDVPYLHVYTENLYSKPFLIMLVIFFHARKISKIGPKVMVGVC